MKNKKAFTLLELMVAMGIMTILIGLSIVGIQTVQRSLRNTQRNDVMNSVNLKIQDEFTNTSNYPRIQFTSTDVLVNGVSFYELDGATAYAETAGQTSPSETAYCYFVDQTQASYGLAVELEGQGWKQFGTSNNDCTTAGSQFQ